MQSKTQGEVSELVFASEALKRHIEVYKPIVDIYGCDFLIKLENCNYFHIQVKSTSTPDQRYNTSASYKVQLSRGATDRPYKKSDFDILAIHIIPLDLFYIIPHKNIDKKTLRLNPSSSKCKWFGYINRWDIIGGGNHP